MSDEAAKDRLRFSIEIADPALADRIASALRDVDGLEIVGADDEPDVLVVAPAGAASDIVLTGREVEVLALLAERASNKLIARRLGISSHTAKYHVGWHCHVA